MDASDIMEGIDNLRKLQRLPSSFRHEYQTLKAWRYAREIMRNRTGGGVEGGGLGGKKYEIGLAKTLSSIFRPIKGGRRNAELLEKVYIVPDDEHEEFNDETAEYILNNHKKNIENFREYIEKLSHDLGREYLDRHQHPAAQQADGHENAHDYSGRFLIIGRKGVGKTILLNYMSSVYAKELDDENIIWVRIDLTRPINKWSVHDLFRHQTLWIFREKYLHNQNNDRITRDDFREFLQRHYGDSDGEKILTEINNIRSIPDKQFIEYGGEGRRRIDILPNHVQTQCYQAVRDYCLQKDCGFVFILDGLDRLRPDTFNTKIYDYWLKTAREVFSDNNEYVGVMIFCLRTSSYLDFQELMPSPENPFTPPCILRVKNVPVDLIYERRFKMAREVVGRIPPEIDLDKLAAFIRLFIKRGLDLPPDNLATLGLREGESILELLADLLNNDLRRFMQAIQISISRLLYLIEVQAVDKKVTGNAANQILKEALIGLLENGNKWDEWTRWKGYNIMKAFICGEREAVETPFYFKYEPEARHEYRAVAALSSDRFGFFANLFSFPYEIKRKLADGAKCCLLSRVRMLQVVDFFWDHGIMGDVLTIDRLCEEMEKLFGFSRPFSLANLDLLEYFGALELAAADNPEDRLVLITPAGRYYLNILLYNHTYLMNVVDNSPIPLEFFDQFDLVDYSWPRSKITVNKMRNGLMFLKYIEICEALCLTSELTSGDTTVGLRVTPYLTENFLEGVERIVHGAFDDPNQRNLRKELINTFGDYVGR